MRIGVQTWGSYGDVRPFLAISGGLAASGHDVTLYVTGEFAMRSNSGTIGLVGNLCGWSYKMLTILPVISASG